ncbi:SDR family oxidoreductase [Pyxidicoccus parkwayensis]|uniref:SDR family oxidoreductase n=2 Tax=Pyxidicoccus parkwayensis TaxID=2813578 RepID=A0ABX7PDE5_9BACT|nr:SDR family oxidoreductase [Pyxidicoccus parkwaysis]
MNLQDQHVVVIGGSSGIGLGVASAALEAGASVTLVGRAPEKLEAAASRLGNGQRVRTFTADVTEEAQVRELFQSRPPVNHVVVTAVHAYYAPIRQFDLAQARRTLDSKLMAAFNVAKHARFEGPGSLTFTGGVAADRPGPGGAVIASVNGALVALARSLALELAPVRVNVISPGWIDTPMWDVIAGAAKQERLEQHARRLPVGRVGVPADIGSAVLFLMGNGFTTGETLHVDGGHRLV